jgi:cyanophycinase
LLCALSYNPFAVGLGLDEDTAAFISPQNEVRVVGSGTVTVVDVHGLGFSSIADAREGEPLCMTDVRVHILPAGARYVLESREAFPP